MSTRPARQVCPLCAHDDDVTFERESDALFRFTCLAVGDRHPYVWFTRHGEKEFGIPQDGIGAQLGVYDTLLSLFRSGDLPVEYGVVEHRFAEADPVTYGELVRRYRHTVYGPTRYSASAFLGAALGLLAREGLLAFVPCRATGYWAYNGRLSAWSTTPAVETVPVSWEAFSLANGWDPGDWPALGYRKGDGALAWPPR